MKWLLLTALLIGVVLGFSDAVYQLDRHTRAIQRRRPTLPRDIELYRRTPDMIDVSTIGVVTIGGDGASNICAGPTLFHGFYPCRRKEAR